MDMISKHPISQVKDIVKSIEKARVIALESCARQLLDAAVEVTPKSLKGGNLRSSAFTEKVEDGVVVGYTASYAAYVHENIDKNINFTTAGTKAKFLSSTADVMKDQLVSTFHKIMIGKIKKDFIYKRTN